VDNFQFESTPRVDYCIGRTLEAMGKANEAKAAYQKSSNGYDHLSGDWDSNNSENLYMGLSLERLGKNQEAAKLLGEMESFAQSQLDGSTKYRQINSRYLLALVKKHKGQRAEAKKLLEEVLKLQPDSIPARLELRGDVIDAPASSERAGVH
jgi:tetratricopeptide (TPR) repeat protein